jgi:hypothetical protein
MKMIIFTDHDGDEHHAHQNVITIVTKSDDDFHSQYLQHSHSFIDSK